MSTTNKTHTANYRTAIYMALLVCLPFNFLWSQTDSVHESFRLEISRYLEKNYLTERNWDSIRTDEGIVPSSIRIDTTEFKYAFHPFWMGTSYRNADYFEDLDRIGYFAYILTLSEARFLPSYSWKSTCLLGLAEIEKCKVDLVVYCPRPSDLDTLLKNDTIQDHYITKIINTALYDNLAYKNRHCKADGINIFIDTLSHCQEDNFISFIKKIKNKASSNKLEVVLSLPPSSSSYYSHEIREIVDLVIPNDFDYYGNLIKKRNRGDSWFFKDSFYNNEPLYFLSINDKTTSSILFLLSILCLVLIICYVYICVIHDFAYDFRNYFLTFIMLLLIVDLGYFIRTIDLQLTINLDLCLIVIDLIIGLLLIRQLLLNKATMP